MRPYEAAQMKLILALSALVYERSCMAAEINFFNKNVCKGHKNILINMLIFSYHNRGRDFC